MRATVKAWFFKTLSRQHIARFSAGLLRNWILGNIMKPMIFRRILTLASYLHDEKWSGWCGTPSLQQMEYLQKLSVVFYTSTASEADQLQRLLPFDPKLRWCNQRKTWSVTDRKRIVFTDEVRLRLPSDGRVTVPPCENDTAKREEIWSVLCSFEKHRQAIDNVLGNFSQWLSKNFDEVSGQNEVRRLCAHSSPSSRKRDHRRACLAAR